MFHTLVILLLIDLGHTLNCHLPRDLGYSCDEPEKKLFYYDSRIGVCQPMTYRGCGGNENKFETAAQCKEGCVSAKKLSKVSKASEGNETLVVDECQIQTDAKIPDIAQKCDNGCPTGYLCNKNNVCCPTKDFICSLPAASGYESPSLKHYPRYVYMPSLSNCIRFNYFGNGGNFNNFPTYKECKDFCM